MRHGFGKMIAADGTEEYTGEWQDNEKTGTGEFRNQSGKNVVFQVEIMFKTM